MPFDELDLDNALAINGVHLKERIKVTVNVYISDGALTNVQKANILSSIPEPKMLVGDLNAYHPAWKGKIKNSRGAGLFDAFEGPSLAVLSVDSETTGALQTLT